MLKRLEDVLSKDVAAFNAKVSSLGVAPIVVPKKVKPIAVRAIKGSAIKGSEHLIGSSALTP